MKSWHQSIDERNRELHALIAEKIRRDPALLAQVRSRLDQWLIDSRDSPRAHRALGEWEAVLRDKTLEQLLEWLASADEEACRMRQSSPFVGIITSDERDGIFRKYEAFRS